MRTACVGAGLIALTAFPRHAGVEAATAVDRRASEPPERSGIPAAGNLGAPVLLALDTPIVAPGARANEEPESGDPSGSDPSRTESSASSAERELTSDDEPDGDDDGRRWWRRNRYPGPIPTPAEWEPPEGPVRIALQAGHWRADEAPDELSGLRGNGAYAHGQPEWEINLDIAQRAATLLEELGYEVDVLPAVVPPGYRAHLFIAIHADGNADPRASGYRVAYPRRDATGRASGIAELLATAYGEATGLKQLPEVTRRMRNYYAFNFRRYEHALHPMTIAVILETGFLTSPVDRKVIVSDPDRAAKGIVAAVTAFPITPPPLKAVTAEAGPE